MFTGIIKVFILYWLTADYRSTKLPTTYANVWTHAFRPMVDILCILCELGSRASYGITSSKLDIA